MQIQMKGSKGFGKLLVKPKHNNSLQLTAQSAGALRVPSAAFGRSGGN